MRQVIQTSKPTRHSKCPSATPRRDKHSTERLDTSEVMTLSYRVESGTTKIMTATQTQVKPERLASPSTWMQIATPHLTVAKSPPSLMRVATMSFLFRQVTTRLASTHPQIKPRHFLKMEMASSTPMIIQRGRSSIQSIPVSHSPPSERE